MLKLLLYILSALMLMTIFLPTVRKDHWTFRVFDYPRIQKFTIIGLLIAMWLIFYRDSRLWYDLAIMGTLTMSFFYLGYLIIPFSPLGKKMIHHKKHEDGKTAINVLVSNVYQYNTSYTKLLQLIDDRDPDIIFLVETDQKWLDAVKSLRDKYPYYLEVPMENTYGLLFYSRLPLVKKDINYLIDDEVPSIIADVEFDGEIIRLYGVHPTPPVPQENMYSTERDAEILLVGKMAKKHPGPCIVFGDLNDVAWSYSTKLFLKSSELLDPRRGRGLYNTFNANHRLLRWPLDHFFVSKHFHLVDMKVERHIGSDHFPISICLTLAAKDDANIIEANGDDKKLIDEKIEAGVNNKPR